MSYKSTGKKPLSAELLGKLVTAKQLAELHDVTTAQVRRAARKGLVPGAYSALGRVGFDLDEAATWQPPEPGAGGFVRREDGRQGYKVYATEKEITAIRKMKGVEVVDPREVRKARKAARAAEAGDAEASAASADPQGKAQAELVGDPFEDFEA